MKVDRSGSTSSAYFEQGYYKRNSRPKNDFSGPTKSSSGILDATNTVTSWNQTRNNVTPLSLIPQTSGSSGFRSQNLMPMESLKRELTAHTVQTNHSTECESPAGKNSQLPITKTITTNSYRKRLPEKSSNTIDLQSPYRQPVEQMYEPANPMLSATTGSFFAELNSRGARYSDPKYSEGLGIRGRGQSKPDLRITTSASNMFRISHTQTSTTNFEIVDKQKPAISPFLKFKSTSDGSATEGTILPEAVKPKPTKEESKFSRQTVNQLYTKTLLQDIQSTDQGTEGSKDTQANASMRADSQAYNPLK